MFNNNICIITKCNHCSAFNLDYKNVRVKLALESLMQILVVAYQ